jgi:hypothetical protein
MGDVIPFRPRRTLLRHSAEELVWLKCGVYQMGGMLPNFDEAGMLIPESSSRHAWTQGELNHGFPIPRRRGA